VREEVLTYKFNELRKEGVTAGTYDKKTVRFSR